MRHLRILNDLRGRYTKACGSEIRTLILVSGGIEADNDNPQVYLIPFFRIEGGLPPSPAYVVDPHETSLDDERATIDAIA